MPSKHCRTKLYRKTNKTKETTTTKRKESNGKRGAIMFNNVLPMHLLRTPQMLIQWLTTTPGTRTSSSLLGFLVSFDYFVVCISLVVFILLYFVFFVFFPSLYICVICVKKQQNCESPCLLLDCMLMICFCVTQSMTYWIRIFKYDLVCQFMDLK